MFFCFKIGFWIDSKVSSDVKKQFQQLLTITLILMMKLIRLDIPVWASFWLIQISSLWTSQNDCQTQTEVYKSIHFRLSYNYFALKIVTNWKTCITSMDYIKNAVENHFLWIDTHFELNIWFDVLFANGLITRNGSNDNWLSKENRIQRDFRIHFACNYF